MQATVKWQHDLLFEGTTENGNKVLLDGQKKVSATPMEMVLMATGSCSSIDVVNILEKAKQEVTGVEVKLEAERVDAVPAVFKTMHLHFIVRGKGISEKHVERAVNLSADKYCSLSIMLGKSVEITHSFEIIEE
ncbi:OsmC family protein [Paraneptunicella aestuarii]|uniref:OsmC family protein n=1 Tax=Paraneptunicella aestuarii TaxID=2831148 RepID=UPI001E5C6D2E|nr:OsmC family protein [Paraneptunicella aestuarii]UAA39800.1 OsmC family protein [Paraneptunicella aestuarii]